MTVDPQVAAMRFVLSCCQWKDNTCNVLVRQFLNALCNALPRP